MFGIEDFNYRYTITPEWSESIDSIKRSNDYVSLLNDDWLYRAVFMNYYIDDVGILRDDFYIKSRVGVSSKTDVYSMVNNCIHAYGEVVSSLSKDITEKYARDLHRILTARDFGNASGRYRNRNMVDLSGNKRPSPRDISLRLGSLLIWYNGVRVKFPWYSNTEVLGVLAKFLEGFEFIRPFSVRNGVLARILVQKELLYAGLPPIMFDCCGKAKYGVIFGGVFKDSGSDFNPYTVGYLANCLCKASMEIV